MDKRLNNETVLKNADGVPYITYDALNGYSELVAGFSTRLGGVSGGFFSCMNLGFERGDERENVLKNFYLLGDSAGFDPSHAVLPNQWHTNNVRVVTKELRGEGITAPKTRLEIDAQITDVPETVLIAYGADCTPIYLFDPVKKAIGLAHSGWKGTLNNILGVTVDRMKEQYQTSADDLICVIGPSICMDCYEIGEEVAAEFIGRHGLSEEMIIKGQAEGKYYLSLWEVNRRNALSCGIRAENIHVSGYCTKCHSDILFSHRAHGSDRGSCAAFMMIK